MRTGQVVIGKVGVDLLVRAAAVISFPIVAHAVGARGYGAYVQVLSVVTFLVPLAGMGVASALIAKFAGAAPSSRDLRRVFVVVSASAAAAAMACEVVAPWLAQAVLNDARGVALFRWAGPLLLAGVLEYVALEYLRARASFSTYLTYQAGAAIVGLVVLGGVLAATEDLVLAVGWLSVARLLLAGVISAAALRADRAAPATRHGSATSIRALIAFGLPLTVANLGLWLMNLGDRLVIGRYLPVAELGRYSAVYTLAGLTALVTGGLFLPAYTRIAQVAADATELGRVIELFHRYVGLLVSPAAVLLVILSPTLLVALGGSEFTVSTALAAVLVGGLVLDQWNGLAHYVLMAQGRSVLLQNLWLSCGAANVAANIVVVPRAGLMGAAIVTLVSFLVLESAVFAAASRHVPLLRHYDWAGSMWSLAAGLAAGAVALAVPLPSGTPWLELVVRAFVFLAVCATGLLVARQVGREDVAVIRSLLVRTDGGQDVVEGNTR